VPLQQLLEDDRMAVDKVEVEVVLGRQERTDLTFHGGQRGHEPFAVVHSHDNNGIDNEGAMLLASVLPSLTELITLVLVGNLFDEKHDYSVYNNYNYEPLEESYYLDEGWQGSIDENGVALLEAALERGQVIAVKRGRDVCLEYWI
jgi:hypothetical protein